MDTMEEVVARELGAAGLADLVAAFYRRVPGDDLLGPMYPEADFAGAETRLREFLQFRFLGQPAYLENRGHPRLRMRHIPFTIGPAEAERWVDLMTSAMDECGTPAAAREVMLPFFAQVAEAMRNR